MLTLKRTAFGHSPSCSERHSSTERHGSSGVLSKTSNWVFGLNKIQPQNLTKRCTFPPKDRSTPYRVLWTTLRIAQVFTSRRLILKRCDGHFMRRSAVRRRPRRREAWACEVLGLDSAALTLRQLGAAYRRSRGGRAPKWRFGY